MRVVAINPNATASMTEAIVDGVQASLRAGGVCDGVTNTDGPDAIQGTEDGARAVPGVLRILRETEADAFIIACFDDTGLHEARAASTVPVIGIGQASYHMANLLRPCFSVVTTLSVSVPVISENIERAGFKDKCCRVLASGVPVLDLERDPETSCRLVSRKISEIEGTNPDSAVILGCAGMGIIRNDLKAQHDTLILDPVVCAGRLIPILVDANSKDAA